MGSGVESVGLLSEENEGELGLLELGLESGAVDLNGRRSGLLDDPLDDGVLGSSTSVLNLVSVPKKL